MSELLLVHHIDVAANDSCIYYGKKIIVEANDTLISDIRFKLFEDSTRLCLMPEISKFVERYLLYLSLLPSSERSKVINDDHVIFDYSTLRLLNSDLDLNLEFADNRYTIEWKNDSQVVSILTFPNQYELISGMNKIESGQYFRHHLENTVSTPWCQSNSVNPDFLQRINNSSLFVQKGCCYMVPDVNQDLFFVQLSNDSIVPVYSTLYPIETIYNLFGDLIHGNYSLNITQHLYGGEIVSFDVPLKNFINACNEDKDLIYCGIEDVNDKIIKAIIIAENQWFGYNHLLMITVDCSIIARKQGSINADVYAYIPTHNVKSLFAEINKN